MDLTRHKHIILPYIYTGYGWFSVSSFTFSYVILFSSRLGKMVLILQQNKHLVVWIFHNKNSSVNLYSGVTMLGVITGLCWVSRQKFIMQILIQNVWWNVQWWIDVSTCSSRLLITACINLDIWVNGALGCT